MLGVLGLKRIGLGDKCFTYCSKANTILMKLIESGVWAIRKGRG